MLASIYKYFEINMKSGYLPYPLQNEKASKNINAFEKYMLLLVVHVIWFKVDQGSYLIECSRLKAFH